MNFSYGLSAVLIGAAIVVVQPQVAVPQTSDEQAIAAMAKGVTVVINGQNPGSGAIVGKDGNTYKVVTAKHVVATSDEYEILTSDGTKHSLDYRTVRKLPGIDLAVVEFTSNKNYPVAKMGDSDAATEGATIYISGWPHPGQAITQRIFQITSGKISGRSLGAAQEGYELVYTNITRSGMSGGPVFDAKGYLIGIHGRAEGENIFNPDTGSSVAVKSGFNLGIPINIFYKQAELTELPQNPSLVHLLWDWGAQFHEKNQLPEALTYYAKVLAIEPQHMAATINTGLVKYEMGDVEAAIERWQKAVQITPNHAEAQFALATALYAKGDRERGLAMARAALRADNKFAIENDYFKKLLWGDRLVKEARQVLPYFLPSKTFEARNAVSFTISPQGRMLAYSSYSDPIKLFDLSSGKELRTFAKHSAYRDNTLTFSPNSQILASGTDATVKLWNVASGKEIRTLTGHSNSVQAVAFSPDGQILASSSQDETIKLWNVASGQEIRTIKGQSNTMYGLTFSPNGRTLVSCDFHGGTLKLWDVSTGTHLKTFKTKLTSSSCSGFALSPDGKTIAVEFPRDRAIKVLNISTGQELRSFTGTSEEIEGIGFSPDGRTLAAIMLPYLHLWDVSTGKERHLFVSGNNAHQGFIGFTSDGQTLVTHKYERFEKIDIWRIPER